MKEDVETRRVAEEFCLSNWTAFAAAAWRGFLAHGRGGLLFDWRTVSLWQEASKPFPLQTTYVSSIANEMVQALFDQYEPETSFVALFTSDSMAPKSVPFHLAPEDSTRRVLRAGESLAAWIITGDVPPPEAHQRTTH